MRSIHRGFSVTELLVAMTVLAVLAGVAAPNFVASIERYRVNAIQQDATASLQLARMEAVRRGTNVILTKTTGCGVTLSGDNDWSCGWEVVVDANANDSKDSGEQVLQAMTVDKNYRVTHLPSGAAMRMNVWGQTQGAGQGFVITPPSGSSSASTTTICINLGGRIKKSTGVVSCS